MKIGIYLLMGAMALSLNSIARSQTSATIYNNGIGAIKEQRSVKLDKGVQKYELNDIPSEIIPSSVKVGFNGEILEQNFSNDLVSLEAILKKYLNHNIELVAGVERISGVLLSYSTRNANLSAVINRNNGEGILMLPNINGYRISAMNLPENMKALPTLSWLLNSKSSGEQNLDMSYLSNGFSWRADYVAVINEKDDKMDLKAWINLKNESGKTYKDVKLKLVAGNVNLVNEEETPAYLRKNVKYDSYALSKSSNDFEEHAFYEYHIYELERPTTLNDKEEKQVSLFESQNISVKKKYAYSLNPSNIDEKVAVKLELENAKANNLGMPIPKGIVRLYKSDGGSIEFIGEDKIEHTPKNEKITLKTGDAFDVIAKSNIIKSERISDKITENEYEVKLTNRKDENIAIEVTAPLTGQNVEIMSADIKYEKVNANTYKFIIPVKSDSEAKLNFKARITW